MCMQCSTNAVEVARDVIPGYTLYQATKGHRNWPVGWYGLVLCNDPEFVFSGPLNLNPEWNYPPGEAPEEVYGSIAFELFNEGLHMFKQELQKSGALTLSRMYPLLTAMDKGGYAEVAEHYTPEDWLYHRIGKAVFEARKAPAAAPSGERPE